MYPKILAGLYSLNLDSIRPFRGKGPLSRQGEVGDQGQVVAGQQGSAAAVDGKIHQAQVVVVVDVVQVQQRQDAGIGAAASGEAFQVGAAKFAAQQAGGEAERPLVEIAGDDARPAQAGAARDLIAHQARALGAALAQPGAQVDVEQVQDAAFS